MAIDRERTAGVYGPFTTRLPYDYPLEIKQPPLPFGAPPKSVAP